MGNGHESVRQIADYVTLTNEEDGVAHAIEKLLDIH
jgi:hydroxymethylpyrimidine pyrophosphatase-like HAD family hydrolase